MTDEPPRWPPDATLGFKLTAARADDDPVVRFSQANAGNCTVIVATLFDELTAERLAWFSEASRKLTALVDRRPDVPPVRAFIATNIGDIAEAQGRALKPAETALLARFVTGDTGDEFWEQAGRAGLVYAPAEETQGRALDRVPRLPHSTAPWVGSVHAGYTSIGEGRYEITVLKHGSGLLSPATKRGQLRFAPPPNAAGLTIAFPGIDADDADELAKVLKRDGRLKGSIIAEAAVQFTVVHPYELIEWDDRFRATFGFKRPGGRGGDREEVLAEARRDFDRALYSRLDLGQHAEHVGPVFSHGETGVARLYTIGYKVLRADGLPRLIRFDPAGVSADILQNPRRGETLGYLSDILALPDTTPGRWATAMIVMLSEYWGQEVLKPECRPVTRANGRNGLAFPAVTRATMFKFLPPDPPSTPAQVLGDINHASRGPSYFDAAVALLIDAELIDECIATPTSDCEKYGREPWPYTPTKAERKAGIEPRRAQRGVDWRQVWWRQLLDFRPGGKLLADLLKRRRSKVRSLEGGSEKTG